MKVVERAINEAANICDRLSKIYSDDAKRYRYLNSEFSHLVRQSEDRAFAAKECAQSVRMLIENLSAHTSTYYSDHRIKIAALAGNFTTDETAAAEIADYIIAAIQLTRDESVGTLSQLLDLFKREIESDG